MSADPVQIKLSWKDPTTGELQETVVELPVAFGRELNEMPATLGEKAVSRIVLNSKKVSRFHALITFDGHQLSIADRSANGTFVQKRQLHEGTHALKNNDTIRMGPYKITLTLMGEYNAETTELNTGLTMSALQSEYAFLKNPLVTAVIGTTLVLLMGVGAWLLVSSFLEKYRPQVPPTLSNPSQKQ